MGGAGAWPAFGVTVVGVNTAVQELQQIATGRFAAATDRARRNAAETLFPEITRALRCMLVCVGRCLRWCVTLNTAVTQPACYTATQ